MALNEMERQQMSKLYIAKAYEAIQEAIDNKDKHPDLSVSRTYYCMFYAAQSLLILEGITELHRHEGVNVKFSELFVKTGEFPKEVYKTMGRIEQDRYEADYDPKVTFTTENAEERIKSAEVFVIYVEKLINTRMK
jgi:uncharacterized protein (UPF0332 family)